MAVCQPDIFYDYEHFTLDKLKRIVPVAQTVQLGEMKATLLSLELYAAGFVGIMLFEAGWERPNVDAFPEDWEPPALLRAGLVIFGARDDLGNHYRSQLRAGSGGGQGDAEIALRNVYCFAPRLAPESLAMTLDFALVEQPVYGRDGNPAWSDAQIISGPWTSSFSVPTQIGDGR